MYLDAWMGNWGENADSYLDRPNVLIVRYEDLLQDTEKWIMRVLGHLGHENHDQQSVTDCIEAADAKLGEKRRLHRRPRGRVNGWKDNYTSRQNAAYVEIHGEILEKLGYETTT